MQAEQPLRTMFQYWDGLRGTRAMPRSVEVELFAVPHTASHLLILGSTPPYEFRFAGPFAVSVYGTEMSGITHASMFNNEETFRLVTATYDQVVATRRPAYDLVRISNTGKYAFPSAVRLGGMTGVFERLVLPLGDSSVDMLIMVAAVHASGLLNRPIVDI